MKLTDEQMQALTTRLAREILSIADSAVGYEPRDTAVADVERSYAVFMDTLKRCLDEETILNRLEGRMLDLEQLAGACAEELGRMLATLRQTIPEA